MLGKIALIAFTFAASPAFAGEGGHESCGHCEDEGIPKEQDWGAKLNQTLTVSMWSSKHGEGSSGKLSTSREAFKVVFKMGRKDKEGFELEVEGRIFARADGTYEVLLDVEAKGGSKDGAMELEMQGSVIVKKGQSAVIASSKDEQFFIKLD